MRAWSGGLDGKIGVTSDLTMNFTVNPDFGQVEADPSVVNLTAYETYFEEKRPFFVEGRNILNYQLVGGDGESSADNLFYSRRIGRNPHYEPSTVGLSRAARGDVHTGRLQADRQDAVGAVDRRAGRTDGQGKRLAQRRRGYLPRFPSSR